MIPVYFTSLPLLSLFVNLSDTQISFFFLLLALPHFFSQFLPFTRSYFVFSSYRIHQSVFPLCVAFLYSTLLNSSSPELPYLMQFVAGAKAMCASAQFKMEETIAASNRCEADIILALDSTADTSSSAIRSSPHRKWWIPLLLRMEGERGLASLLAVQCTIDQGQDAYNRFKHCTNVRGLIMLVGVEFEELETARSKAIQSKSVISRTSLPYSTQLNSTQLNSIQCISLIRLML